MVEIEPQKISLTDKLIETRNNDRTVNFVNRGVLETTSWSAINELADLYATYFIEKKITLKTCAMIGQYSKDALAQFVACILTGNTVLMLEPDFPDRFDILDDTETEIAIIDKKYLTSKFLKSLTVSLLLDTSVPKKDKPKRFYVGGFTESEPKFFNHANPLVISV